MNGLWIVGALLGYGLLAVYVERKLAAWVQDRQGPLETGPYGLLQTLADLGKLLRKQETIPATAVRRLFLAAPALALVSGIGALAWLPGIVPSAAGEYSLWLALSVLSLEAVALFLGGWASGSKYALLGAFRLLILILAYELVLGFLLLTVVAHYGTLELGALARQQEALWGLLQSPGMFLAGLLWIATSTGVAHRAPFDLPETESELVAGALTEYSGFRFALFMLAEYILMLLHALWVSYVFLGGLWAVGVPFLVLLQMLLRWAWPRWRPDQVLTLAWKGAIPLAFASWVLEMLYLRWLHGF